MPSCAASTPARSVSRGACFGPRSPLDGLPCSDRSGASGTHLRMPSVRAYCSCDPGLPGPFRGNGGDGISSPLHAVLSAQGSNASGFAVVASSAPPASPTLAVLSVGAGAAFVSNDAPFGSIASTAAHPTASAPAFPAAWTGPRPTHPASSGGSSHEPGGFKASRWGSVARNTGAAPSPGAMPGVRVSLHFSRCPCSLSDGLSHSGDSGSSSPPLRMPSFGASHGTNIDLDETLASGSTQHGITNVHI
jgi:hypothetical protein